MNDKLAEGRKRRKGGGIWGHESNAEAGLYLPSNTSFAGNNKLVPGNDIG
jgi:hypothetical protein